MNDLRFAVRQIRRAPAFAFFIIATLAIGIGANTTIFSAVNALLLKPLPFEDGNRLVKLSGIDERSDDWSVSLPNAVDMRKLNRTLTDVAYHTGSSLTLERAGGTPERLEVERMTPNTFQLLGFTPQIGRLFTAEEDEPGKNDVALLSNGAWRQYFGGDPSVIGTTVTMSGRPVTIIGVMPATFTFPSAKTQVYIPVGANETTWGRGNGGLTVIARMKPDVTLEETREDMTRVGKILATDYPQQNEGYGVHVTPLREAITGGPQAATMLAIIFAAVGLVLLIACVNVANLLLARATSREREVAVRAAMGAGRARIIKQFLTESLVLALFGGAAGVLIALWGTNALPSLIPEDLGLSVDFGIDGPVLLFTTVVTVLTGMLFGAAPALKAATPSLSQLLGGRTGAATKARGLRRSMLVVAEVALAVVLLVSAGLMIRSFSSLTSRNPGFQASNLLSFRVAYDADYKDATQTAAFEQSALAALRALPGVTAASTADFVPISGTENYNSVQLAPGEESISVGSVMVGPGYTETMRIPLVRGRGMTESDRAGAPPVAMVNQAFVDRHLNGQDPIGKRLLFGFESGDQPVWRTIVGVFGNVLHGGLDSKEQRTEVYVPISQLPWRMGSVSFVVRTQGDPATATEQLRDAVWSVDPSLAVYEMRTMERMIHDSQGVVISRLLAGALGLFGGIALLLAAIGLYGVISYSVAQRTYEIGVRAALGADTSRVLKLVVTQGLRLVIAGLVIGLAGALAVTRVLDSALFGISTTDPITFIAMSALLTAVAMIATAIPARRAARIDPMVALRTE